MTHTFPYLLIEICMFFQSLQKLSGPLLNQFIRLPIISLLFELHDQLPVTEQDQFKNLKLKLKAKLRHHPDIDDYQLLIPLLECQKPD